MPYLVWDGAEVARKVGRRNWKCFCGYKEAHEYFIHVHLEEEHRIVNAILRQDNENYDGRVIA